MNLTRVLLIGLIVILVSVSFVIATNGGARTFYGGASTTAQFASNYQQQPSFQTYYGGRVSEYWPILGREDQEQCEARQDLIIQVAPAGCQPAVVRSDLLEEQDVPVFCQLDAFKINPLIDISEINNIRFRSNYPKEVKGVGFHPAKAALRTYDRLLGSPTINNIGYAVVILRKQANESSMPNFVNVTLSARVEYNSGNALGIGRAEFLLKPDDKEFTQSEKARQSFWQGRYYVRLERAEPGFADVAIYKGDIKVSGTRAEIGKLSNPVYLPGSYCRAGLQVAYDGFEAARPKARLEVGDAYGLDIVDVYQGSKILDGRCDVTRLEIDSSEGTAVGSVSVRCGSREEVNLQLIRRQVDSEEKNKINSEEKSKTDSEEMKESVREAIRAYEKVVEEFPAEKIRDVNDQTSIINVKYGEQALDAAIKLAEIYGNSSEEERLINKMLKLYPGTAKAEYYRARLLMLSIYDISYASGSVYVDGKYRTIRLLELEDPEKTSKAIVYIDQSKSPETFYLGKEYDLTKEGNKLGRVVVAEMRPDSIKLRAYCTKVVNGKTEEEKGSKEFILRENENAKEICNQMIRVSDINVNEVARIRLIPFAIGTNSEVNVTVGIGIEKRAIKLNPDKTKERIENLNKSIEKFEKITENLGKVVTTMKGVCFASAGVLTAKTFLTGLKGEGIARQQVMGGEQGWTERCKEMVNNKEKGYDTLNECFLGEAANINKDVKAQTGAIQKVNEKIRSIEEPYKTKGGLLSESSVNTQKAAKDYAKYLIDTYKGEKVGNTPIEQLITEDCYEKFTCDYTTLRDIEQAILSKRAGVSEVSQKNLNAELRNYESLIKNNKERIEKVVEDQKLDGLGLGASTSLVARGQNKIVGSVRSIDSVSSNIKNELIKGDANVKSTITLDVNGFSDPKRKVMFEGGTYVAGLQQSTSGDYIVRSVTRIDRSGNVAEVLDKGKVNDFLSVYGVGQIISKESVSYSNRYKNPEVRYFETSPYKGLPALVPIDTDDGWYAATKQTLPAFGGIGGFESSGRVNSFWLCNVGKNGREQFQESGHGDDLCQLVNLDTGQSLGVFPGLEESKARELVGKAIRALTDAANQYGNKPVVILGKTYTNVKVAPNVPAVQCQDFMDPKDCYILFNACDPVICPNSRCDFGGEYQVADVIQTGIIGSTLLCLPNAREKIAIPVCLTGIHAGLESYISILKSHRDCLQENIATGKTIGICDQITSVYMCEFFWRQGAPLAKVLLPKLVELAYTGGQSVRGGGEYMTVSAAWNNAQKSLNFFTQHYAVNSLKAYRIRSVEEAGTQVCKAFISAKAPTKFKSLIEPDSPPQFYAWFSAIRYSDATLPATSQYKVFYHIFAGQDSGIYYRVYLKNPPETGYYYSSLIVPVASGFISKGEYKTETKDFTAPEGYQELCLDVNGEEKCGFKQVSSDFAINYVRDKYAQNEVEREDIKSEMECISGTPTLKGAAGSLLVNVNPQFAAEEALYPEVYDRGIVRICATENPGSATNPQRYQVVGNCGEERVKCWLDKESVGRAITDANIGLRNEALKELEERENKRLTEQGLLLGADVVNANLKVLEGKVSQFEKEVNEGGLSVSEAKQRASSLLQEIKKLFGEEEERLVQNHHKAEVLLRKAQLNGAVALAYVSGKKTTGNTNTNNQKEKEIADKENNAGNQDKVKKDNKEEQKIVMSLKGSAGGYNAGKKYVIAENKEETRFYIEGTKVTLEFFLLSTESEYKEEVGVVRNRKIDLFESKRKDWLKYFELIDDTEIKEVEAGKDWQLVKIGSSEATRTAEKINTCAIEEGNIVCEGKDTGLDANYDKNGNGEILSGNSKVFDITNYEIKPVKNPKEEMSIGENVAALEKIRDCLIQGMQDTTLSNVNKVSKIVCPEK